MPRLLDRLKNVRIPRVSLKPSTALVIVLLIAACIFTLGGGVYDIMENPIRVLPTPSNPVFWFSGMTDQTFNESAYFIIFLIIGISGGYTTFISSRYAYRPREGRMLLLIGIAMMIIATVGSEVILSWKGV